MSIEPNKIYIFSKSGNAVREIAPASSYCGLPVWEVERTQGEGAGKRMHVLARALAVPTVTPED